MLERTDFVKKQIVVMFSSLGEKASFRNDNLILTDKDKNIKFQITCYRIFALFIIGDISITSGLIQRTKKFGFTIILMNRNFKLYSVIGTRMEGNTLLHRKQYEYNTCELANFIVMNKIRNQREALNSLRRKNPACKEAIETLDSYIERLKQNILPETSLLGIEGSASRVYFPQIFNNVKWDGRKPRLKCDYVNSILDIGYNLLFNIVDALLQTYGFDVYCGIYHKEFYMRKSLVCDLMEPLRPVIDLTIRKAINLRQFQEDDFDIYNNQYVLKFKASPKYIEVFIKEILERKDELFIFIQSYYRAFMKGKPATDFQEFSL